MRLCLACALAGLTLFLGGTARAAVIADFVTDFSTTANPNGAWRYGVIGSSGDSLTVFTNLLDASGVGAQRYDWNTGPRTPLVGVLIPDSSPSQGILHPGGSGVFAAAQYVAQSSFTGLWEVSFQDGHFATTDVHVLRNGVSLFDADIDALHSIQTFQVTLAITLGDVFEFVAGPGPGGAISGDTTFFTATLSEASLPEPASIGLMLAGLAGLGVLRRRGVQP